MKKLLLALFCLSLAYTCIADIPSDFDFIGTTTIKFQGTLPQEAIDRLATSNELCIVKDFFALPLFPEKKGTWGCKYPGVKISYKPKRGKSLPTLKSLTDIERTSGPFSYSVSFPTVALAVGETVFTVNKGSQKCKGTIENIYEGAFEYFPIIFTDGVDSEFLGNKYFAMTKKGKNLVYADKGYGYNFKITIKAKGQVSGTVKVSEDYLYPIFLRDY